LHRKGLPPKDGAGIPVFIKDDRQRLLERPMTLATRDYHPSKMTRSSTRVSAARAFRIPADVNHLDVSIAGKELTLTNLHKPFWPDLRIAKRDLIQYYADVSPYLLPHLRDRAMVMKRYPHGAYGTFFFMKRAPVPRPAWIQTCSIEHESENVIDFPMVQDLPALLWLINLGCIDLNPWYARCDDVDRPDYLHFDLDPVTATKGGKEVAFERVLEVALIVHEALSGLKIPNYAKTTGSRGIHVYVPIVRGPTQKQVWGFAKMFAQTLAKHHPELITAEYKIAKRPQGRVLVDYNQNAWGRTLASINSVRP
jgi:bifunctional non-homologous end joining protein LigD